MNFRRCILVFGIASSIALITTPPASANIFGDAARVVKKTTKNVVRKVPVVGREITGDAAKDRRMRKQLDARQREGIQGNMRADVQKAAKDRQNKLRQNERARSEQIRSQQRR